MNKYTFSHVPGYSAYDHYNKYTFSHVPGYSAYDHYAAEVIAKAKADGRTTKQGMESALVHAWKAVRPHAAIGPRIDIVKS